MTLSLLNNSQLMLIILWLLYFSIHSLLASLMMKQYVENNFPVLMPAYRIIFNIIALLLLIPPVYIMHRYTGEALWVWSGKLKFIQYIASLTVVAGFFWTLRYYKSSEFSGIAQWREGRIDSQDMETFSLSPIHRYVRHPWYSLALLYIWTRDMNTSFFISASLMSLYFIFGSHLEEKKLLLYHGQQYKLYRQKVAGLIPLPWRILSQKQVAEITGLSHKEGNNNVQ